MQAMRQHSRATGLAKVVGIAVASYAKRDTALAWPSNDELADWGLSKRRLQLALRSLEELGELKRQPDQESHLRRRVYLIDPEAGRQLSLLDAQTGAACAPVAPVAGAHMVKAGARHARAGKEPQEPQNNNNPPNPPVGGLTPNLLLELQQTAQTPTFPSTAQGAGGARRRRTRRRDRDACVASEPCPLQAPESEQAFGRELEEWAVLERRLRERIGAQWEIWAMRAHPHPRAGALVVAVKPECAAFLGQRFGRFVDEVVGGPVAFVGCASLKGAR